MYRICLSLYIMASVLFTGVASAQQDDKVTPERKRAIDSLALEKVRDLSKYISIVGNKSTEFSEANRVIDRAQELFANESKIGVSSLKSQDIRYYSVKEYFKRLMALNYDKVQIDWYDIQYISDLEKQPDGRYVGVITIYQKFEGSGIEGLKYRDVTKKDITVYVERKSTQVSGREIGFWDVLLGDIRVSETKP
jgi:ABC-type antimicrobial peptide transport system permease subunit